MTLQSYFVPNWMDDGEVTLKCRDDNSEGGRDHHRPERGSCDPDATDKLIPDTVTWHTSAGRLENKRQYREERHAHVYGALVHDEDIYRLNIEQRTDEEIRLRTGQHSIDDILSVRKLHCLGHVIQMDHQRIPRLALHWEVPGFKRGPNRPRTNWRSTVNKDLLRMGITWEEAEVTAQNRSQWRRMCDPMHSLVYRLNQGQGKGTHNNQRYINRLRHNKAHNYDRNCLSIIKNIYTQYFTSQLTFLG